VPVIDARRLHDRLQGAMPACVFGVGEARVFLRDDGAQAFG